MSIVTIPFGQWLPSQPTFNNPGCEVADNVIPRPGGYGPFLAWIGSGDETTEAVKGGRLLFTTSGASLVVGGSSTYLFTRRAAGVTETSSYTAIGSYEAWDFAQFNDYVIATAQNNAPQYLSDIDTDDTWSALPGSPPTAKRCAKVGEFLMLGNLANEPNAIQWSQYNNPTATWGTSRRNQSGKAYLPQEFGEVMRIVGGRYPLVFQDRGISRLSYVGSPIVWRRDDVTAERGTIAPFSVVPIGFLTYFLSQDGFYVTNGSQVEPIGTQRVNEWFFDVVDQASIYNVQGAVDWQNECVIWSFSSNGTTFDRKIIFSPSENRWSSATITTEWIVESQTDAWTLEDVGTAYPSIETVPVSLDAKFWSATNRTLGAFIGAEYGTFSGLPLEATWQTGSAQPSPNQSAFVSEVVPVIDADSWDMTARLMAWDNRNVMRASASVAAGNQGFIPVSAEGKKVAVEMTKPAGSYWSGAQGVQVRVEPAGFG